MTYEEAAAATGAVQMSDWTTCRLTGETLQEMAK